MAFDGAHRLVRGDYVRIDGRLGPWAGLVEQAGIDPMSLGSLFFVLGAGMMIGGVGLLLGRRWAWSWAVVFAMGTLWYLPFGTGISALILLLLFLPSTRAAFRRAV